MAKSEKDKMLAGELYNAGDPELVAARLRARVLTQELSTIAPGESETRRAIVARLLGYESDVWLEPPFFCDYGSNLRLGKKVYFNFNCVVLDVAQVTIGDNTLIGPGVQILTATHPLDAAERRSGLEAAKPISIGTDVWIGGGAILCPGVSIGDRSVIGAGSVVTRDVPPDVVVAGNPARVLRTLPPSQPETGV